MNTRFLNACNNEKVDTIPVWFMRQAGRYLNEYRKIRENYSIIEIIKNPEICAYVSILPVKKLNVDACILFSDLTTPLIFMDVEFDIVENEGPILLKTIENYKDISNLKNFDERKIYFVGETISILKQSLDVPIIGFIGGPFTFVSYLVEGKATRNFIKTKFLMLNEPKIWHYLMEKITENLFMFAKYQIEKGVDALQIFDSWIYILGSYEFENFVLPYLENLISKLKSFKVPIIYFSLGDLAIKFINKIDADVFSIDWRVDISQLFNIDKKFAIQGNLDPCVLLTSFENIKLRVEMLLNQIKNNKGYIFNCGHGILPQTPVENVKMLVEFVHQKGREIYGS
jgi:uroporphyrinogen decarboxylase